MNDISPSNFGILIAYLLPGFVALWGVSQFSETIRSWLTASHFASPSVGGFLYATLASVAAGLTASTLRWLVIDTIHHNTGIPRPHRDPALISDRRAFQVAVSNQYRYFQFYGNMIISIMFAYTAIGISNGWPGLLPTLAVAAVSSLFWLGSRDTLRNYSNRLNALRRPATGRS